MSTIQHQFPSFFHRLGPASLTRLLALCALACASLSGCTGESNSGMATDTKTNWLDTCEESAECEDGLSCLCGVCTKTCDEAEACSALATGAACSPMSGCGEVGPVCTEGTASDDSDDETTAEPSEPNAPSDDEESDDESDDAEQPSTGEVPGMEETDEPAADDEGSVDAGEPSTEPGTGPEPGDAGTCPRPLEEYSLFGEECFLADFNCMGYFMDECGCGCAEEPEPMCGHPADEYRGDTETCQVIRFECDEDEEMFHNDCGCGCTPAGSDSGSDGGVCDIPGRNYVAHSPAECAAVTFLCIEGTVSFFDDCGCGCATDADGGAAGCDDPARQYASEDPEECQLIDLNCQENPGFSDECGCGCIVAVDPACDIEGRSYVSRDPMQCIAIDFLCEAPTTHFFDDCGCGCESSATAEEN